MRLPYWGDLPTWLLFAGAVVTAYFAYGAFRVQSDQLRVQSKQVQDQQKVNKQLAEVLPLQKEDFEQAREERKREQEEQRRAQANKVAAWTRRVTLKESGSPWEAMLRNASDLPVLNVLVKFYWYDAAWFEKDPWAASTGLRSSSARRAGDSWRSSRIAKRSSRARLATRLRANTSLPSSVSSSPTLPATAGNAIRWGTSRTPNRHPNGWRPPGVERSHPERLRRSAPQARSEPAHGAPRLAHQPRMTTRTRTAMCRPQR